MIDPRRWFGQDDDEEQDPVKKTLRYLGLGAAAPAAEPPPAAQPSFAPEDYSTATIAPPAPAQPAITAPFQDTYTPAPEPPPAPTPGIASRLTAPPTAGFPEALPAFQPPQTTAAERLTAPPTAGFPEVVQTPEQAQASTRSLYETISPYIQPAGGAPEQGRRIREINDQAARDQGKPPTDVRAMFTAAEDPGWRTQNPDLAAEYDELQDQYGVTVGGTIDPVRAARRARIAARGPLPELPEGALPIRATPEAEASRLRLDLFPPDVRADIQAAAEGVDYARTQRRGVLPDAVVQHLADEDASSVDQLIKGGRMGRAYNPEETVAIRNAVGSQANVVRDLSEQIAQARADGTTPDLLIARRAAESTKLQGLVQVAEGARAEAGRTLRQYAQQAKLIELDPNAAIARMRQKIADPDEFAKIVDQYTQIVNEGADPIELAKLWARVERGEITGSDLFALYRRFNMLSGPRTFETNALSGALNLGYEVAGQSLGQVARGRVGEAAVEAAAPIKAAGRAFGNLVETMRHGVTAEQAARGEIPRSVSSRTDNPLARTALTVAELPDRFNAAVDQFYRTMTEDWAATMLAHRQARAAGLRPGSADWADTVATNLEKIREDPSRFAEVKRLADRVTFSEEPGSLGKGLEAVRTKGPGAAFASNLVMPFIRTPYNIASRAVDISPLGPVRTAFEAATGLGRGRANLSERARDNMLGTAASVWAYQQAQAGNVTGAGPDDPEKRAELRATGWQPYSVKIGDQYWSYANFAPFNLALSTGAAAAEAQKYPKPGGADPLSIIADGAARTAGVVSDMTVLAGLGAVAKGIQDPDRYGTQWLSQFLQTLIPAGSALNTLGQATDPLVRRSERTSAGTQIVQNVEARLPDVVGRLSGDLIPTREDVPAAQDPLGRPIASEQTGWRALNPFRPTTEREEPVLRAFLDAGVDIGAPPKELSIPDLRPDLAKPALTPEEQRRWNELRGEAIIRQTQPLVEGGRLARATPAEQTKKLEEIRTTAADYAHRTLRQEIGDAELKRRSTMGNARRAS